MPHWPWGFSGRQAFGMSHNEGTLPSGRGKVGSIAMYRLDIRLRIAIDLMEERSSPTQDTKARWLRGAGLERCLERWADFEEAGLAGYFA